MRPDEHDDADDPEGAIEFQYGVCETCDQELTEEGLGERCSCGAWRAVG